jgi:hypothetical protein
VALVLGVVVDCRLCDGVCDRLGKERQQRCVHLSRRSDAHRRIGYEGPEIWMMFAGKVASIVISRSNISDPLSEPPPGALPGGLMIEQVF